MTFCSVPSNWFLTFILSYITSSSNSLAKGYDPPPLVIIGWRRWYYMYIRAIKLFHDIVIFGMRFISAYTMKVTINIIIHCWQMHHHFYSTYNSHILHSSGRM
jgi:hypothetical protein